MLSKIISQQKLFNHSPIFIHIHHCYWEDAHLYTPYIHFYHNSRILDHKVHNPQIPPCNFQKHSYCCFWQRKYSGSFCLQNPPMSLEHKSHPNNSKNINIFHSDTPHFHCIPRDIFSPHKFLKKIQGISDSQYTHLLLYSDLETCIMQIYYPL